MTDPDNLKSAAAYLREIARSPDARRRHRKQPKIDALRQCKEKILQAYRSGVNVHRIAQIFREHNVDISTPHLMRAIRQFIEEEEHQPSNPQQRATATEALKTKPLVTYQVPDQPSGRVQEEEFAKERRHLPVRIGAKSNGVRLAAKSQLTGL